MNSSSTLSVQYGDRQPACSPVIHLLWNGSLFTDDLDIHGILDVPAAPEQAYNFRREETIHSSGRLENPRSRRPPWVRGVVFHRVRER
jgi:hypothetical protein